MISTAQANFNRRSLEIIVYDLNLSSPYRNQLLTLCNVHVRSIAWHAYPAWVRRLKEYRWKVILWAVGEKVFLNFFLIIKVLIKYY
jgi:hypothetical protein